MIVIDGSQGEGGGQIIRSALALSLVTGSAFRVENIRARREKPGLLRQHLTAVNAAGTIGDAAMEGAQLGSMSLTFVPKRVRAGNYRFAIGTAGSTTLVLQTILLPLAMASETSEIEIEGGTHNPHAPPYDFMELAYIPLLRRMGVEMELELVRPGFYPAGGGEIRVRITPTQRLAPLEIKSRGELVTRCVRAVVANLPYTIAQREVQTAAEDLGWPEDCLQAHTLTGSVGPGNAVSVVVGSENVTDVFTAFGARGVQAEHVAHKAATQAKRYIDSGAAVGEHLADQLLLPLTLAGKGSFTTTPLSGHSTTGIDVMRRFIDVPIDVESVSKEVVRVTVGG
jgi:RNA 3'-terminal phosphate cyclase (ATP)